MVHLLQLVLPGKIETAGIDDLPEIFLEHLCEWYSVAEGIVKVTRNDLAESLAPFIDPYVVEVDGVNPL
jgi:hypothetical protein